MTQKIIEADATSTGPPAAVWAQLADVTAWTRWGTWSKVEVEGGGEHAPGAVRALDKWPYHLRELVTDWEPEQRMGYQLLDGMPVRGYESLVTLEPAEGGGTKVHWRSTYDHAGPFTTLVLRMAVRDACKRVAKAAAS